MRKPVTNVSEMIDRLIYVAAQQGGDSRVVIRFGGVEFPIEQFNFISTAVPSGTCETGLAGKLVINHRGES